MAKVGVVNRVPIKVGVGVGVGIIIARIIWIKAGVGVARKKAGVGVAR